MSKPVNQEALRIEKIVTEGMTIQAETGEISGSKESYEKALPEGLVLETVKTVHTHDANYMEGSVRAHTAAALELFAKNKKLEEVRGEYPTLGRDRVDVVTKREKEVSAGIAKEGETPPKKTVYGATHVGLHQTHMKSSGSDLKKFLAEAQETFASKIGKK